MSQVIRNLLYNAINHTGKDGHITVEITTRLDAVHVAIANPGEAIRPKNVRLSENATTAANTKAGANKALALVYPSSARF